MGRSLRWIAAAILLIALGVWVQRSVGWVPVLEAWKRFEPADLAAVLALTMIGYVARAFRLGAHFGGEVAAHRGRSLRVMVLHNAANNLMPMRAGELSFPLLLQREFGISTAPAVAALLWLRVLDLLALVAVASLSLATMKLSLAMGIVLALLSLCLPWPLRRWLASRELRSGGRLESLREGLPTSSTALWQTQFWTLLHWISKLGAYAWILHRLGEIPFSAAGLGAVAGEATSVLPIHGIAGAGTYEGGVVLVLRSVGVQVEAALMAATDLHLFLLIVSILAAAIALVLGRKRPSETDRA